LQPVFFDHPVERAATAYDLFLTYEFVESAGAHAVGERSRGVLLVPEKRPNRLFKQALCARALGLYCGFL
jgi:hypothetical protein